MSYIGNTSTTQAFSPVVDYASGNGSTTAFTLSRPVASVAQVQVTVANVPQNPTSAYTISGQTITFTSAPPSGTNNIYVYYTSPITQVIAPGQGTVTTTSLATGFTLPVASGGTGGTTSTGSGAVVLATSPTLVTPNLGTPSALVLTNATGLPQAGLGTNVAGNGPAFAYTLNTSQSISVNTSTKVVFDTKVFDTANSVSSGRFTPTVAGYYQINSSLGCAGTTTSALVCSIYKNGSLLIGNDYIIQYILTTSSIWVSDIVYLNGTTDYVEIYGQVNAASGASFAGGNTYCKFSGALIRTA